MVTDPLRAQPAVRARRCILFGLGVGISGLALAQDAATANSEQVEVPRGGRSELRSYMSGNGFLNRGLYDLAIPEYRAFLAEHPDHEKADLARYGLGVAYFRMGEHQPAVSAMSPLEGKDGFSFAAEVSTIIGQCHLALGRYDAAAAALTQVVARHPSHELACDAAVGSAEAYYRAKRFDDAATWARTAARRWPDSPLKSRALYFWGLAEMARHEFVEAASRFRAVLSSDPEGPYADSAASLMAQSYERSGSTEDAIRQYESVLKRGSAKFVPDALLALGMLLQKEGRSKQAGVHLDRLIEQFPDHDQIATAHMLRGRAWLTDDESERAAQSFQRAKRAGGDNRAIACEATFWSAKCRLRQSRPAEAVDGLRGALNEYPSCALRAEMLFDLAVGLIRSGDDGDAVAVLSAFRQAFADHELAADALDMMAHCEHRRGNFAESLQHCTRFLTGYPRHELTADVSFLLGENRFLSGDYESAVEAFRRFVDDFPAHAREPDARFRLGTALYRLGRFDEAEGLLRQSAETGAGGTRFATSAFTLGDLYFQRGEWKSADRYLRQYLADGTNPQGADDAMLEQGIALARLERWDEAIQVVTRLVDRFPDSARRVQAVFEKGQILLRQGRHAEARTAFEEVVEADAEKFTPHALNHLATIAVRAGRFGDAAELYQHAADRSSDEALAAEAGFQAGEALMSARRFAEAERVYSRFVSRYPGHARASFARARRAIAIARQDRCRDALPYIAAALAENSAADKAPAGDGKPVGVVESLQYERAWCQRALGQFDAAARSFRDLVEASKSDAIGTHALLDLAGLDMKAHRFDAAAELLKRLHAMALQQPGVVGNEVHEQGLYQLGVCAFEQQDFPAAAETFEEFLAGFPQSDLAASACYFCGESLAKTGRHDRATKHFRRLVRDFPKDPSVDAALLRLGESLGALQQWSPSEQAYAEYRDRYPRSEHWFQAEFGMGWAREHQGRHEEAIRSYRNVVARHNGPTAARAQFQIGECLFALKRYDEAVRELLKVDILYAYPEWRAAALFEAGRCFEAMNQSAQARRQFEQVASQFGQSKWSELARQRMDGPLSSVAIPGR